MKQKQNWICFCVHLDLCFRGNENVQNITHLSPKHLNEQFSWKLPLKTSFHFSSRFWCDWQILQAIGPFWISSGYSLSEMSVSSEPNFWRRGSRWTWTPSITATRYFYLLISPPGGWLFLSHTLRLHFPSASLLPVACLILLSNYINNSNKSDPHKLKIHSDVWHLQKLNKLCL